MACSPWGRFLSLSLTHAPCRPVQMSGDKRKAHEHLKESHKWSAEVGFVEGVKEASGALERMDAGGSHATPGQ